MEQDVHITIPTEQSVTVVVPAEQVVTVAFPGSEQDVTVTIPTEQNVAVVIPTVQSVAVVCGYSETPSGIPVLLTGPTATPDQMSCLIEWTTDIEAYHRVRYRKQGVDEWTITDWSSPASTSASITLSPLLMYQRYYYDIQSCSVGDGSMAFDWYPFSVTGISADFKTLPTSIPLILSLINFAVTKNTITANYTSSEACTCSITGKLSTFPFYASWYSNLVEHASPHSHTKTGLTPSTTYHIKIKCTTNEGATAYLPAEHSHYVVQTANSSGAGGGLQEIAPD